MDALIKVLAGSVNQHLVAALIQAGASAVGLSGVDANLVIAEQMDPALGAVGKMTHSNPELLVILTRYRFLPVVACLAGDGRGGFFNVNGDQMAVGCATAFAADRLVFLTDVDGVLDGQGKTIPGTRSPEGRPTNRVGSREGRYAGEVKCCSISSHGRRAGRLHRIRQTSRADRRFAVRSGSRHPPDGRQGRDQRLARILGELKPPLLRSRRHNVGAEGVRNGGEYHGIFGGILRTKTCRLRRVVFAAPVVGEVHWLAVAPTISPMGSACS